MFCHSRFDGFVGVHYWQVKAAVGQSVNAAMRTSAFLLVADSDEEPAEQDQGSPTLTFSCCI